MRIQKIIANSGYCSRRKAEVLIEKGLVFVDGKKIELGFQTKNEDIEIIISGEKIRKNLKKEYYILNKPKSILVTKDDPKKRKTIYNLSSLKKLFQKIPTKNF